MKSIVVIFIFFVLTNLCIATQSNKTKNHLEYLTFTSKIHIFMLKMMGKHDLIDTINSAETSDPENTTATSSTTTGLPTTTTKKLRKTKSTTTVSTTTELPWVYAETRIISVPKGLRNVLMPIEAGMNRHYQKWFKEGRSSMIPVGYHTTYTPKRVKATTPKVLTDSDYYEDD